MELFKLLGTIAINNTDANNAIDETANKSEGLASKFESFGSKVSNFGEKLSSAGMSMTKAITVPAVAAGGALIGVATKSASAADNIDKMSQKIGISREAYQELDFICSQTGTSVDGLQMGLKTMTAQMDKVSEGNKAATANFERLGVSVQNSDGSLRSQEEVLWETLSALQGMENQTEKARLATELFGRSGTELMPLLNGASGSIEKMKNQAHELGLVLGDEAIDAGVEYTDKMDQLRRSFAAVAVQVGTELLPYLTKLGDFIIKKGIPAFKSFAEKIGDLISKFTNLDSGTKKLILTIAGIVVAIGPVLTVAGTAISVVGNVISVVGNLTSGVGSLISTGVKLTSVITAINPVVFAVIASITALIAIGVALYKNWDEIKEFAGKVWDGISSACKSGAEKVGDFFKSCGDGIHEFVEGTKEKWNDLKENASEIWNDMKSNASETWETLKTNIIEKAGEIKERAYEKINGLKEQWAEQFDSAKQHITETVSTMKDSVVENVGNIVSKGIEGFNDLKEKSSNAIVSLKDVAQSKFEEVGASIEGKFSLIGEKISSTFGNVKENVKSIVDSVKEFFNFDWQLPKIKLPHFSIEWNSKGVLGNLASTIGLPGLPKLNVDWYKKAMNDPVIMDRPTAFGINARGQIMAGGEAGSEVVSGTNTLMRMIQAAVDERISRTESILSEMLYMMSNYYPAMANKQVVLSTGEVVGALANPMNEALGKLAYERERGY